MEFDANCKNMEFLLIVNWNGKTHNVYVTFTLPLESVAKNGKSEKFFGM